MWIQAIASLSNEQLQIGLDKCKERIFSGDPWAPDMADFLAMIHGSSDTDFQGAFWRCLNKCPEGRIEKWVSENIGYNVRVSPHHEAERMHKKWMLDAIEKESRGDLHLQEEGLKALPVNSVKNLNDITREKYNAKTGGKLNPRIARILASKKGDR
jgi:hypothetical protein